MRRLRSASPTNARLGVEVLACYRRSRQAARSMPLPDALEQLRRPAATCPRSADSPDRLARATRRTLRLLPTDTRCLMQSLTLTALLARRGISSTLVIGVAPGETFGAHAWVELEGRALLPPGGERFPRIVEL